MSENSVSPTRALPVYLVEDDEVVLRACEQAIKLADIPVRSFHNAEQALADGCTPTNPVAPTHQDLVAILRQLL